MLHLFEILLDLKFDCLTRGGGGGLVYLLLNNHSECQKLWIILLQY